ASFRGALKRRTVLMPRASAKDLPQLSLADALELTVLVARKDPRRHPRVAAPLATALPRGGSSRDDRGRRAGRVEPRRAHGCRPSGGCTDPAGHGRKSD